jgi:hypothetical protein
VAFQSDEVKPEQSHALLLLDLVSSLDPPAQVILDVGAQILEQTNLEVAKHWLKVLPKDGPIQVIVFVNDNDDICVIDRKGRVEPLQISPFARQMEACYVFLDEAHTRGIDLKLPKNYRAAVTLGPGITKDKLVQGKIVIISLIHDSSANGINSMHEDEETGQGAVRGLLHSKRDPVQNLGTHWEARQVRYHSLRCTLLGGFRDLG